MTLLTVTFACDLELALPNRAENFTHEQMPKYRYVAARVPRERKRLQTTIAPKKVNLVMWRVTEALVNKPLGAAVAN
eukprot:12887296-Prorocentrum_lima.AAC.1